MGITLGSPGDRVVPGVRKIAVVRANALGDFLFAVPALEALRAAYPDAEIVLLGRDWHQAFLGGRPGPVDRVVAVPHGAVGDEAEPTASPAEVQRFFDDMAGERFDLALQLHGGGRNSNPFTLRLGAGVTAGLKTPDAPPLDRWAPYIYFQHEVLRYLEVVGLVGAAAVSLEPHIAVTAADLAEADAAVPRAERPLVALHPGATDRRRRWPAGKFAAVGCALAAAGARVVVTGTEPERDVVTAVVGAMRAENAAAQDLCGRLSLGGLAGLLSRCAVVVANDTGPRHLAAAVGAATVGIYWCFNLVNAGPLTRTRHRPVASWRLDCPSCGVNCIEGSCGHSSSFVAEVSTEDVIAPALDLLALAPRHQSA